MHVSGSAVSEAWAAGIAASAMYGRAAWRPDMHANVRGGHAWKKLCRCMHVDGISAYVRACRHVARLVTELVWIYSLHLKI
jgi:hypothetical protein